MSNGSREGIRMTPERTREIFATRTSQFEEWRCLSLREARMLILLAGLGVQATDSNKLKVAEQDRTASLEDEMMSACALYVGTRRGGWFRVRVMSE
jgi:hypothetical protein